MKVAIVQYSRDKLTGQWTLDEDSYNTVQQGRVNWPVDFMEVTLVQYSRDGLYYINLPL